MNKIYDLEGFKIKVGLKPKLIRIYSNAELWHFFEGDANSKFELLVLTIKKDYKPVFDQELKISNNSLIVEILVHVYCDYIGSYFNRIVKIGWSQRLVKLLLKRAEIVDCGEKTVDGNRWVWDLLARFKSLFIRLSPNKLNVKNLKMV